MYTLGQQDGKGLITVETVRLVCAGPGLHVIQPIFNKVWAADIGPVNPRTLIARTTSGSRPALIPRHSYRGETPLCTVRTEAVIVPDSEDGRRRNIARDC